MKNLAKVSLALLSTVFLLGCQERGSGPVGPEGLGPEFTHRPGSCKGHHKNDEGCGGGGGGGGKVTGTFTATFPSVATAMEDVTGGGELLGGGGGKEGIKGGGPGQDPIQLTFNAFLQTADGYSLGEGMSCFPAGAFSGVLQISENTPGSTEARIQYNFKANGTDGTPNIAYTLILRGVLDPMAYAPTLENPTAEIDGSQGTFEVGPKGGPGDISCKGTGSVNFSVLVTRTS